MFACAHPAIEAGIRAPLMLQVVLGLDAQTIASAFLTSPAAMGKRLVRAKDKIRQAGIPFRIPQREELPGRLDAVLDAIYAAFAEGWTDPGGTDVARRDLAEEAMFLARLVAELLPEEPEALGLLALMLHAEARRGARRDAARRIRSACRAGSGVCGTAQMIDEAEALLRRAAALGRDRPLSARSRVAVGARPSLPHRSRQLAGGGATLRRAARARRLAGRRHQSRPGHRRDATAPAPLSRRCKRWRPMRGSPNTSPTGPRAPSCWPRTGARDEARRAYEIAIGLERDPAVRSFLQRRQSALLA